MRTLQPRKWSKVWRYWVSGELVSVPEILTAKVESAGGYASFILKGSPATPCLELLSLLSLWVHLSFSPFVCRRLREAVCGYPRALSAGGSGRWQQPLTVKAHYYHFSVAKNTSTATPCGWTLETA